MRFKSLLPLLALAIIFLDACKHKGSFKVSGTIKGLPQQTVYLEQLHIKGIEAVDSTTSDDQGHFELSAQASEPGLFRIRLGRDQFIMLSGHNEMISISGDWSNLEAYQVAGSSSSASLRDFMMIVREHIRDFNTMAVAIDTFTARGDDSMVAKVKADAQNMNLDFTRFIEVYADTTTSLPNALFAVQMLNPAVEMDYLTMFTQSLEKRFPGSVLAKDFTQRFNNMMSGDQRPARELSEGSPAPEIALNTPDGKLIKLSSLKGKYVLVDFWASWCGPCRAENPNVVAAYNKFKDKNFTILGVSLDSDKDRWLEAIKKDKLTWTHVSDLKKWESIAVRDYNIQGIPANFLVDPNGNIIARDLRGPDLELALQQFVK